MKRTAALFLSLMLLFAVLFVPGVSHGATDNSWARVLLSTGRYDTLTLNVMGSYFIYDNGKTFWGGTLTVSVTEDGRLSVTHSMQGLLYTGDFFTLAREYVSPSAGAVVFTDCDSAVKGNAYLGHFHFTVKESSSGEKYIRVVNEVPLDQYLYGVIGHEMSNSFPIEALKAQAVVSASYVVTKINTGSDYHFTDSSSSDQVYSGYDPYDTRVIEAVDAVTGEVMFVDGKLLRALFCSSNGGETSLPLYEWGEVLQSNVITTDGYVVQLDPYDLRNPSTTSQGEHETLAVSYGEATAESLGEAFYGFLCAAADTALGTSGAAVTAVHSVSLHTPPTTTLENGTVRTWSEFTRNMTACTVVVDAKANGVSYSKQSITFSPKDLKTAGVFTSSRNLRAYWGEATVDAEGNETGCIIHRGRWGSGIGLSQRGAQQMANEGFGYRDILAFYFPNAEVDTIVLQAPFDPVLPGAAPVVLAKGVINADGVALRSGPSTYYQKLSTLAKNSEVEIYGELGAWDYVMVYVDGELYGYVHSTYITVTERSEPEVPSLPDTDPSKVLAKGKVINVNESVNFRAEASSGSAKVGSLPKDTVFDIYARSGAWYYIYVGTDAKGKTVNKYGYIYGHYVGITEYLTPEPVDAEDIDGDGSVTVLDALLIAKEAAQMGVMTSEQKQKADIDRNSSIGVSDALRAAIAAAK